LYQNCTYSLDTLQYCLSVETYKTLRTDTPVLTKLERWWVERYKNYQGSQDQYLSLSVGLMINHVGLDNGYFNITPDPIIVATGAGSAHIVLVENRNTGSLEPLVGSIRDMDDSDVTIRASSNPLNNMDNFLNAIEGNIAP